MWSVTGVLPSSNGSLCVPPGKTSDIITIESPISTRPCISLPSGMTCLSLTNSFAPNAFLYHSIASAAPLIAKYGVTLRNPSGIGLGRFDFDFDLDFCFAAFLFFRGRDFGMYYRTFDFRRKSCFVLRLYFRDRLLVASRVFELLICAFSFPRDSSGRNGCS